MANERLVVGFDELDPAEVALAGGKACALAALARAGLPIPAGAAVTTHCYRRFLTLTGLRERIALELSRKDFAEMRWEELWDAAVRIRNLFLTTPLPDELQEALARALAATGLEDVPVAVRSSAPGEDTGGASFAGLHESYVNVRGTQAVVEHVRMVWASLWSDGALLYRRELRLDPRRSAMAVVVQRLVIGERSGVCFTMDPADAGSALVEAVHGLNQGLVDGTVEPDRWRLERASGRVVEHRAAVRERWVAAVAAGVRTRPLPEELRERAPLQIDEVAEVLALARRSEEFFGAPQDVEWTMAGRSVSCVQSRPITTGVAAGDDRAAYLSLRRSFDNLRELRRRIEDEVLPTMTAEADEMAAVDLAALPDAALRAETLRRRERYAHWIDVYSLDLIPFAHGARLFGQVYNDVVKPADPYEFADLLRGSGTASVERNRELERLAGLLRGGMPIDDGLDAFLRRYGDTSWGATTLAGQRETIAALAREMARRGPAAVPASRVDASDHVDHFFELMGDEREYGEQLLDLGRASYRLRDDDNLYVGRVEGQLLLAVAECRRRGALSEAEARALAAPLHPAVGTAPSQGIAGDPATAPDSSTAPRATVDGSTAAADRVDGAAVAEVDLSPAAATVKARQLLGQPAGPGIAVGLARVVLGPEDLAGFRAGEVLVCDAIDPSMTFVVPLAAAIVERRGGMLIHGAIIAREYGLPCVTGVPDATRVIHTGDRVAVDGHLGIVVVG